MAESASPAVKTTAVLAASGGLVAAFALPAQAAQVKDSKGADTAVSAPARPAAKPAAPAAPAAPAVAAPKASAKASPVAFGLTGFTATAKPKPKPKPVAPRPAPEQAQTQESSSASEARSTQSESRSQERSASRTTRRTSPAPATTTRSTSLSSSSSSSSSSTSSSATTPSASSSSSSSSTQAPAKPKTTTASKPATGGVLSIAASLSGIYYVYGGTTTAGFDCSGFTSYVFRQVGISLPRTAEQQRQAVTRVSNPQPGDLVFFGSPSYHVGIYAGNGMMYDSPRSGKTTGLHKIWSSNVSYGRP
ncbi:C40 family peptidase [Actinomycetota bacterium]